MNSSIYKMWIKHAEPRSKLCEISDDGAFWKAPSGDVWRGYE